MPLDEQQLQIVPMGFADINAVLVIESVVHSHPWSEKLFLGNFGKRYFNHLLLADDKVIGYFVASSVAGEVTLMNIAIAPIFQGHGCGKMLLAFLLDFARKQGEEEIWLEVRASNKNALHLYQQAGFVEVDCRKNYYPLENGREDAIIMCCYL